MTDGNTSGTPQTLTGKSTAATLWAVVVGWALVRIVTAAYRPAEAERPPHPAGSDVGEKQHAPTEAAHERGRGRRAETPTEIPARGWKDIAWRVYEQFTQDRVMSEAAGVTYYALLALFPAIAALVSIYGLFADPGTIESNLNALSGRPARWRLGGCQRSGQTHRLEGRRHARVWLYSRPGDFAVDCECWHESPL